VTRLKIKVTIKHICMEAPVVFRLCSLGKYCQH